jgi:hypothetical protein
LCILNKLSRLIVQNLYMENMYVYTRSAFPVIVFVANLSECNYCIELFDVVITLDSNMSNFSFWSQVWSSGRNITHNLYFTMLASLKRWF